MVLSMLIMAEAKMMSVGVTFTRDLKFGLKFRRFYFQFVHIMQCSADYNNRIR